MKRTLLFITIGLTIFSCIRKGNDEQSQALIIGDPLDCGINNVLMFPLGTNYTPKVYHSRKTYKDVSIRSKALYFTENKAILNDRYAQVEYLNENTEDFDIRNILFYNLTTGNSYSLHDDTLHILSFAIHKEFDRSLIFYRMVKKDLNEDGKFNSEDPVMLYVSDLNGDSLCQVTSENEKFIDYFYYPLTQTILVKTIIDSDQNKEFEPKDETNFLEMKILQPAFGKEIFSKSLKDSLRVQMNLL